MPIRLIRLAARILRIIAARIDDPEARDRIGIAIEILEELSQ